MNESDLANIPPSDNFPDLFADYLGKQLLAVWDPAVEKTDIKVIYYCAKWGTVKLDTYSRLCPGMQRNHNRNRVWIRVYLRRREWVVGCRDPTCIGEDGRSIESERMPLPSGVVRHVDNFLAAVKKKRINSPLMVGFIRNVCAYQM
jgi:hypothetical protein